MSGLVSSTGSGQFPAGKSASHAVCQQPGLQTRRDEVRNRLRSAKQDSPRRQCWARALPDTRLGEKLSPECRDNPAFPNADRDVLIGWSAKSSGRHTRVKGVELAERSRCVGLLAKWHRLQAKTPALELERLEPLQAADLPILDVDDSETSAPSGLEKKQNVGHFRHKVFESPPKPSPTSR